MGRVLYEENNAIEDLRTWESLTLRTYNYFIYIYIYNDGTVRVDLSIRCFSLFLWYQLPDIYKFNKPKSISKLELIQFTEK